MAINFKILQGKSGSGKTHFLLQLINRKSFIGFFNTKFTVLSTTNEYDKSKADVHSFSEQEIDKFELRNILEASLEKGNNIILDYALDFINDNTIAVLKPLLNNPKYNVTVYLVTIDQNDLVDYISTQNLMLF